MRIGILGYGEVGQGIAKVYADFGGKYDVKIKSLDRDDGFEGIEVLDVCIPFIPDFVEVVSEEIKKHKPSLTIIHSTVAPGTTKKIAEESGEKAIVHSPIRGVHPYLYEGIKTMVKMLGADDENLKELAKEHLEALGLKVKALNKSVTTELGKLLDTTYYGVVIAWHGEMKKLCDSHGIDFEEAVSEFNKTYNEGYISLGKSNVVRPVLYPPVENKIGGHCVISNAEILKKDWYSKALDLLLDYK